TDVRHGAAIALRPIHAADAQDAAGLLLFTGADHLLLVGRDAWLVDRLAGLEPTGRLRSCGSGRADQLGGLGCYRGPPAFAASRCRRGCIFDLPVGSLESEF